MAEILESSEINTVVEILEDHIDVFNQWINYYSRIRKTAKALRLQKQVAKLTEIINKLKHT